MTNSSKPFDDDDTLWVVHIGNNDRIALRARDEGFVCIGWTKLGDLRQYDNRDKMKRAMKETWPDWSENKVRSSYGQPYRFAHEMEEGEPLVFPVSPTSEIAIGRIAGPYEWSNDDDLVENDYGNVRPVEWLDIVPRTHFSQAALHSFGSFLSVSTSDDYLEEILAVLEGDIPAEDRGEPETTQEEGEDEEETSGLNLYESATQETEDYLLKAWQRTGTDFEHVVGAVFEALGYTTEVTQASGDQGVDVIAHPDPLGMEEPYIKIQAKSGTGSVGGPEVRQLSGTLNRNEQGVLVALGRFSSDAQSTARSNARLTLIGPKKFVRLFLDHYDQLAPEWRSEFPLKQVHVPF